MKIRFFSICLAFQLVWNATAHTLLYIPHNVYAMPHIHIRLLISTIMALANLSAAYNFFAALNRLCLPARFPSFGYWTNATFVHYSQPKRSLGPYLCICSLRLLQFYALCFSYRHCHCQHEPLDPLAVFFSVVHTPTPITLHRMCSAACISTNLISNVILFGFGCWL